MLFLVSCSACFPGCRRDAPQGDSASYLLRELDGGMSLWVDAYALDKQVRAVVLHIGLASVGGTSSGTSVGCGSYVMSDLCRHSDGSTSRVTYDSRDQVRIAVQSRKYSLADGPVLLVSNVGKVRQFKAALPSTGPGNYTNASSTAWSKAIESLLSSSPEILTAAGAAPDPAVLTP